MLCLGRTLGKFLSIFWLAVSITSIEPYHNASQTRRSAERWQRRRSRRKVPERILKRSAEPIPTEETVRALPDRRAIEGVMRSFVAGLGGSGGETPLSMAQDVMYKAFESNDPKERAELAKKALELSPDCADAYVLLAEQTKNRKAALELLEKCCSGRRTRAGEKSVQGRRWTLLGPDGDSSLHAGA